MKNISQEFFLSSPIEIPPLTEQRKIAEILSAWDSVHEKLSTLRALKERRLIGLRAALLFGKLRLNGQRRNWAPTRLGAVTRELTKRNGEKGLGRDFVMGVTKAQGVVPMREQTIAGDISRYKRLPPRAFAYNPMRINVGSIAMNEREDEVLVSPDYVVFACNADGLDPDYLDHLRKTSWWAHYINSGGSGSVRQRTYYDDLAALKLPLPELDEQKAIAAVLNTARADLAATEHEIEAVTLQKRGLMQKLLTGKWRVPLAPAETSAITEETEHAG
jgi:type I restriction enzyme S subunit